VGRPTVSTVRAAAGVSNADATRYLKEWSEEKQAAGGQVAAAPAALLEQAARLAGACWAEASGLADGRHAAVEAEAHDALLQRITPEAKPAATRAGREED
jgi:hypothetical protein